MKGNCKGKPVYQVLVKRWTQDHSHSSAPFHLKEWHLVVNSMDRLYHQIRIWKEEKGSKIIQEREGKVHLTLKGTKSGSLRKHCLVKWVRL